MVLIEVWINKNIVNRAAPEHKLELWSFEASPVFKHIKSVLNELELPLHLHSVAKMARYGDLRFFS